MAANEAKIVITADDKASGQLDSISQKAKSMRTAFLAVSGAVTGVGIASIKFASDLDESVNKATVTFGNAADVVREFGESSASAFGISERAANEYSGTLGTILNASGLAESASAEMSVQLVKLAADMASFNNIPIDVALEKLRSGLVGEVEPLRTVGVLLSAAEVNAEAYAKGIAQTGAQLTEAQKVQARYSLILSQTTAQQGDFTRTSDSLANSTRIMKAQLEDAAAQLGQQLLPAAQKVVEVMNDMIGRFSAMSQGAKTATLSVGGVAGGIAGIGLAIPPVITGITLLRAAFTSLAIHPIGAAMTVLIGTLGLLILKMRELENETNTTAMSAFDALDKQVRRLMVSAGESGTALSEQDAAMQALINTAKDYAQAQNEATRSAAETVRELNLSSQGFDSTAKASQIFGNRLKEVNKELKPDLIQKVRGAIEQYGLSLEQVEQIAEASGIQIAEFGTVAEEAAINTAQTVVEANNTMIDSFNELGDTVSTESEKITAILKAQNDAQLEDAMRFAENLVANSEARYEELRKQRWKDVDDELKAKAAILTADEEFEKIRRAVMGLPPVIASDINQGRPALTQQSADIFNQMGANAMVIDGRMVTRSVTGQLNYVLPTNRSADFKQGSPEFDRLMLETLQLNARERGVTTIVVEGDVYGFEDFADKVEQAQAQNRDAGAIS